MPPYTNVPHTNFSAGLNLKDAVNAVGPGEALDCLNVLFSERGAVKQRDGYAQFTAAEVTNQPDSLAPFYDSSGNKRLVVGNGNHIELLDTSGTPVASSNAPTASPHFFCRFGGPTAEVMYIANGTDQVRKLSGIVFSAPGGLAGQTGKFLAVTPTSNRLMVARETGATLGNNPSSVNFSAAGSPEDFTGAFSQDLDPGDGEAITGMIAWRELVFVFKETKFWVHYGESTDATGNPLFQFRKIDTGVGLVASKALCKGPDGVYFMGREGIYRTMGGEPELVSGNLDPFFGQGTTSIYFKSNNLNHGSITGAAATWHDQRLYFAVPTGSSTTNDRLLVFDPRYGWWTMYDIPAAALAQFRPSNQNELVFAQPTGNNYINRFSSSYTADAMGTGGTGGAAITARWRSGWIDFDSPERKRVREVELWGTGSFTYNLWRDFRDSAPASGSVTLSANADTWGDGTGTDTWGDGTGSDLWGPSNSSAGFLLRSIATRAQHFSFGFSNSTLNAAFTVYRTEARVDSPRIPSVVNTEA